MSFFSSNSSTLIIIKKTKLNYKSLQTIIEFAVDYNRLNYFPNTANFKK